MPQDPSKLQNLLFQRQPDAPPNVQLPTGEGDDPFMNKVLRAITTGVGLEGQKPGDAAGAAGSAMMLFPPAELMSRGKQLLEETRAAGAPQHIMDVLEFAQKRWPRLFGHLDEVGPLGAVRPNLPPDVAGVSAKGYTTGGEGKGSTSVIGLNPYLRNQGAAAYVFGHELTHAADRLANPQADNFANYVEENLPNGYFGGSHEVRARLQGERVKNYMRGADRRIIEPLTSPDSGNTGTVLKDMPTYDRYDLDSRITNLPPGPKGPPPGLPESSDDKLYRIIRDRQQNPTPRVPQPGEDKYGAAELTNNLKPATPTNQPDPWSDPTTVNMFQNTLDKAHPPGGPMMEFGRPVKTHSGLPILNRPIAEDLKDLQDGKIKLNDFSDIAIRKLGPMQWGKMLRIGTPSSAYFNKFYYRDYMDNLPKPNQPYVPIPH